MDQVTASPALCQTPTTTSNQIFLPRLLVDEDFAEGDCTNFELIFEGELKDDYQVTIFAVNYNILRIMSGMGGLLYS